MKIKSVGYKKGFVEIKYVESGSDVSILVIAPKDIINNYHAAQQQVERTALRPLLPCVHGYNGICPICDAMNTPPLI